MIQFTTVSVTDFQQNCRIISTETSDKALVIDPGGEASKILKKLKELGKECSSIWLTHSHLDHCGGVADLMAQCEPELVGHPGEEMMRGKVQEICQMYGLPAGDMKNCPEPSRYLSGGENIEFEGESFEVLFTPGHSPGHLSFYHKDSGTLLGGDALFAGSIGRTDLPGGDHQQLISSIKEKILSLPENTTVLSGHGPNTTVGQEKASNPFLT